MATFRIKSLLISFLIISSSLFYQTYANSKDSKSQKSTIKILLIGNSYFGYNNMPEKIRKMASKTQKDIQIKECIIHGWSLSMHADNPDTYTKIKSAKWDFVVLLGSQDLAKPEWHYLIKPYVIELKKAILENSSSTKIFCTMPWPYKYGLIGIENYVDTWEDMSEDLYRESAKFARQINISIAPAGWAWYNARKQKNIDLYMEDQSHPNNTGSYLLACVIYSSIFVESCVGNPYLDVLNAETATFLQKIASETVLNNLAKWNISETTDIINPNIHNEELSFYNSPNPFKEYTNIHFFLKKISPVNIKIFNSKGEQVKSLHLNDLSPGSHIYSLPTNNLKAGIYICSIYTDHYSNNIRIIKM